MLAGLGATIILLFLVGPYEPVETDVSFDAGLLDGGVVPYLAAEEERFLDIRRGEEKRVIWHGLEEVPTDLAVAYFHGFSGSSEELRPVPDMVAAALEANLVFTRFTGHGRDGAALGAARARDWMRDAAEALAIARAAGHEVIVIATSTGGTIAALAALDPEMARDVKGIVFVSPNFGLNHRLAAALRLPAARYWLPLVAEAEVSFEPVNEAHARHWTTAYPATALLPVSALVRHAAGRDYAGVTIPALFFYAEDDTVVDAEATADFAARWGGPVTRAAPDPARLGDPYRHIPAGDILSPENTRAMTDAILRWVAGLP